MTDWEKGPPIKRMAYRVELAKVEERIRAGRRRALRIEAVVAGAVGFGVVWIGGQALRLEGFVPLALGLVLIALGVGLIWLGARAWRRS